MIANSISDSMSVKSPRAGDERADDTKATAGTDGLCVSPLVTNTESSTTLSGLNRLKAPSLKALGDLSKISKRYVLQSVSKEMLGACSLTDGKRSPFYRLGACGQLSNAFRPGAKLEVSTTSNRGLFLSTTHDEFNSFAVNNRDFANHFAASIGSRVDDNGISQYHFSGLCKCESGWICPLCQPKITEFRSKEVAYAMHQHQSNGGYLVFCTFTVPHHLSFSLKDTISAVADSVSIMKRSSTFQRFKSSVSLIGTIRALEWTYTKANGHHPHIHDLWFFDSKPDLLSIKRFVYDLFCKQVLKHKGFDKPSYKHGLDMRLCLSENQLSNYFDGANLNDVLSLAGYITKGADLDSKVSDYLENRAWGAPEELTKSFLKSPVRDDGSKITSYNQSSILVDYLYLQSVLDHESPSKVIKNSILLRMAYLKKIYHSYALYTKGRAMLYWSRGLKDRFGVYDLKDRDILKEFDSELVDIMSLDISELQKIVRFRLRGKILEVIADPIHDNDQQRIRAVREFISSVQVRVDRFG